MFVSNLAVRAPGVGHAHPQAGLGLTETDESHVVDSSKRISRIAICVSSTSTS